MLVFPSWRNGFLRWRSGCYVLWQFFIGQWIQCRERRRQLLHPSWFRHVQRHWSSVRAKRNRSGQLFFFASRRILLEVNYLVYLGCLQRWRWHLISGKWFRYFSWKSCGSIFGRQCSDITLNNNVKLSSVIACSNTSSSGSGYSSGGSFPAASLINFWVMAGLVASVLLSHLWNEDMWRLLPII